MSNNKERDEFSQIDRAFPDTDHLQSQIDRRHRNGSIWRIVFQASTIIGIIALTALLYNILNSAFGLVAVQEEQTPESLVLALEESKILRNENTVSSEDDNELANEIVSEPNSIGFFGYAYYRDNSDTLKILNVNGVEPNAETAESGEYPLARPLFLYTTAELLEENPAAADFVAYYLSNLNAVVDEVGYFPVTSETYREIIDGYLEAAGLDTLPEVDPALVSGDISIAGSSTVFPITRRMADMFVADGYTGNITVESIGSTAGLRAFCIDNSVDVANASRPINSGEYEACREIGRRPLEIRVGTDALAVVTSADNSYLSDLTLDQLRLTLTEAQTWQDVDAALPAESIQRFVPGADSGTLDFLSEQVFTVELADLSKFDLVQILASNISVGVGRRLEREQLFFDGQLVFEDLGVWNELCASEEAPAGCNRSARSQQNVLALVRERVVVPDVVATYSLVDSIFNRSEIVAEIAFEYPNANVEFRSWLTPQFLASPQSSTPELAGVRTAIFGSLWVVAITVFFSFPVGVGAAIYLEEYATDNRFNRIIQTNINNLAGVPSIIYGLLGLAIFVRVLEPLTSGAFLGSVDETTANGRTVISAGLTLGLLILPLIIINAQEAIRAVPNSMRQAGMALGATKWQTIWSHVLPSATPGIMTGTILAISRAIGETAPLVVVGASTFITVDPDGPFAKFTALPIQIYQWTARPQGEFRNIAAAAIIVLLIMLLTLNATAVLIRNRATRRAS